MKKVKLNLSNTQQDYNEHSPNNEVHFAYVLESGKHIYTEIFDKALCRDFLNSYLIYSKIGVTNGYHCYGMSASDKCNTDRLMLSIHTLHLSQLKNAVQILNNLGKNYPDYKEKLVLHSTNHHDTYVLTGDSLWVRNTLTLSLLTLILRATYPGDVNNRRTFHTWVNDTIHDRNNDQLSLKYINDNVDVPFLLANIKQIEGDTPITGLHSVVFARDSMRNTSLVDFFHCNYGIQSFANHIDTRNRGDVSSSVNQLNWVLNYCKLKGGFPTDSNMYNVRGNYHGPRTFDLVSRTRAVYFDITNYRYVLRSSVTLDE